MKKLVCLLLFISAVLAQDNFNIEIDLPDAYLEVGPGEEIWFTTKVINLGNENRMDITLNYEILNSNGFLIVSKSETVAIGTQASFVGNMEVPDDLGNYYLRVILTPVASDIPVSEAETSFKIVSSEEVNMHIYLIIGSVLALAAIIFGLYKSKTVVEKIGLKIKVYNMVRKKHLEKK